MDTKRIRYIPAEKEYVTGYIKERLNETVEAQLKLFAALISKLTEMLSSEWVKIENKDVWFNPAVGGIFPNLDTFEPSKQNIFFSFVDTKFKKSFAGYEGTLMSLFELRASHVHTLPKYSQCLFAYSDAGVVKALDVKGNIDYSFNASYHNDAVCIPSVRFSKSTGLPLVGGELITVLLAQELVPTGLSDSEKSQLAELTALYAAQSGYVLTDENAHLVFDSEKIAADIKSGKFAGSINGIDFSPQALDSVRRIKADESFTAAFKISLLTCEKRRADIDPYDEKLLSDPNRGHWELWRADGLQSECDIELKEPLIARNPISDINTDGVIAIDFGTKSTVVVFQKCSEHTLPMAIGTGRLSSNASPEHYENPTVMEFVDLGSFLSRYNSRDGRPETLWEQLPISHTAYEDLKNIASKDYYSFFCDLKSWAGEGTRSLRICDKNGGEYLLPPYMSDETAPFDPIEIYAYYIGLYINNMRNGIYTDYYLSFPVTFEKAVKDRITASFSRGLLKSLPESVLEDDESMADFRVDGSVSEPAAYAACAIGEYNVYPAVGEYFHYGIFDFGGGTADYDFGVMKVSEKRKYDYTIENYGAGGDKYLGGENLLSLMAYHVFKRNLDKLLKAGITFTSAAKAKEFAGSSAVIARSREAEANMRHLMEKLRPVWEGEEFTPELERGVICVDLYDKSGELLPMFELDVSAEELTDIIRREITSGIDSFISAMCIAYTSSQSVIPEKINVMLAGNSCRSRYVTEIFESKFPEAAAKLKEALGIETDIDFMLYPPLGTEQAYDLMERLGLDSHRGSIEHPTGKTGVAFGLIKCRKGGSIERTAAARAGSVEEEIPFKYFIGHNKCGKFIVIREDSGVMTLSGKPDYGKWYNFTDADEDTFEIYYTSVSEAVENALDIENVRKKKCRLNVIYPEANVYIRATGPKTLEYTAATENGIEQGTLLSKIYRIDLEG